MVTTLTISVRFKITNPMMNATNVQKTSKIILAIIYFNLGIALIKSLGVSSRGLIPRDASPYILIPKVMSNIPIIANRILSTICKLNKPSLPKSHNAPSQARPVMKKLSAAPIPIAFRSKISIGIKNIKLKPK